jgi:hypothetical protein
LHYRSETNRCIKEFRNIETKQTDLLKNEAKTKAKRSEEVKNSKKSKRNDDDRWKKNLKRTETTGFAFIFLIANKKRTDSIVILQKKYRKKTKVR